MKRILDYYIFRECIPPFLGGLCIFGFILLMDKVLRIIDLILMKGIGISHIARLLIYIVPPLLVFTIPMSILFATLMTFGRLASDNEIVAFWSCGLHPLRVIAPILALGVIGVFVCLWLETGLVPSINSNFRSFTSSLQQKKAFLALNKGEFRDLGKDMVAYVHDFKNSGEEKSVYSGILIADQRNGEQPRIILANEGKISFDKHGGNLVISLVGGEIHSLDQKDTNIYQMIKFGKYEMTLELPDLTVASSEGKRYKELSQNAISNLIKSDSVSMQEKTKLSLEWHRRFAFPVACLIFAYIGSLIGMLSKWAGKGSSFAVSLVLILIYYFIMIGGFRISMAGYLAPWISIWLPNLVFLGIGIGFSMEAF